MKEFYAIVVVYKLAENIVDTDHCNLAKEEVEVNRLMQWEDKEKVLSPRLGA